MPCTFSKWLATPEIAIIARQLQLQGVQRQDAVLIIVEKQKLWTQTFFAIIKIGAMPVLVNFDDRYQLAAVLANGSHQYICTDNPERCRSSQECIVVVAEQDTINSDSLLVNYPQQDVFLGLYTSGSSGEPKYVEKSYLHIMSELQFLGEILQMDSSDVVMSLVPQFHIYGLLFGVLLPTLCGATIVYTDSVLPREVLAVTVRKNVNFLVAAPIHYQTFVRLQIQDMNLQKLKYAISSGAPLAAEVASSFYRISSTKILEFYGSTETGGIAYQCWQSQQRPWLQLFPYVETQESSSDETQQLLIRSPTISTATLDDGWYATGDFVQFSTSRSFRIIGRCEQILKVGGKRIATSQLERELLQLDIVDDVVVIPVAEDGLRGESAVAFVKIPTNRQITSGAIRRQLQRISSNAAAIKKIVVVAAIPRDQNGKVSYNSLRNLLKRGADAALEQKDKLGC